MKNILLKLLFVTMLTVLCLAYSSAQPLPGPDEEGTPIRPSSIGSGWVILLGAAAAYGATKTWMGKKKHFSAKHNH